MPYFSFFLPLDYIINENKMLFYSSLKINKKCSGKEELSTDFEWKLSYNFYILLTSKRFIYRLLKQKE